MKKLTYLVVTLFVVTFLASCSKFELNETNLAGTWNVIEYTDKTTTPVTVTPYTAGEWTFIFDASGGFTTGTTTGTYTIVDQDNITLTIGSTDYPFTVNVFEETKFEIENSVEKFKFEK